MKFGKRLKRQIEETIPEWRDKFLSYKRLKRLLAGGGDAVAFLRLLDAEVDKFNAFFLEQEEEFVIRQRELKDRMKAAAERRPAAAARMRKEMVDLHGEMVLLVNYSRINYTGLSKIVKKFDKRTGSRLRTPFIRQLREQPFLATEIISRLVRECESTMEAMFPAGTTVAVFSAIDNWDGEAAAIAERSTYRNTVAALVTMQELHGGTSTYIHQSLPTTAASRSSAEPLALLAPSPIPI